MNSEKEDWVGKKLKSIEGISRAMPDRDLIHRIEQQLDFNKFKIVSIRKIILTAVAVLLLLLVNIVAINQYLSKKNIHTEETDTNLIIDYTIYYP